MRVARNVASYFLLTKTTAIYWLGNNGEGDDGGTKKREK